MRKGVVLPDGELSAVELELFGIPGTVPLVSGRAPALFWFLSLS